MYQISSFDFFTLLLGIRAHLKLRAAWMGEYKFFELTEFILAGEIESRCDLLGPGVKATRSCKNIKTNSI